MKFCHNCINSSTDSSCFICQQRTIIYDNEGQVMHQFIKYIRDIRKKFKIVTCTAHNAQGFDSQFVLKQIVKDTQHSPKPVMRGTKIIYLSFDNVRFLDSLCYFPMAVMALSALPKAFSTTVTLKKGTFPHLFNTLANANYVGPLPDLNYYSPDTMSESARNEFLQWYEANKNTTFDFKKELIDYCTNDVEILAQACIAFRKIFLNECNVDPFLECTTIASACNLVFRRLFLKPNEIGLIPKNGYRLRDNQSAVALHWLLYEEQRPNIVIVHAGRGSEHIVLGIKVDGYYESGHEKNIFSFLGEEVVRTLMACVNGRVCLNIFAFC